MKTQELVLSIGSRRGGQVAIGLLRKVWLIFYFRGQGLSGSTRAGTSRRPSRVGTAGCGSLDGEGAGGGDGAGDGRLAITSPGHKMNLQGILRSPLAHSAASAVDFGLVPYTSR